MMKETQIQGDCDACRPIVINTSALTSSWANDGSELAKELEVSERHHLPDITALSIAGVPVYGESGPDGGYALVDNYRTNLTGLTRVRCARCLCLVFLRRWLTWA